MKNDAIKEKEPVELGLPYCPTLQEFIHHIKTRMKEIRNQAKSKGSTRHRKRVARVLLVIGFISWRVFPESLKVFNFAKATLLIEAHVLFPVKNLLRVLGVFKAEMDNLYSLPQNGG